MSSNSRGFDFLIKEIQDPYVRENFWRLKSIIDNVGMGQVGPQGPIGPIGPSGPTVTAVAQLIKTFTTDVATLATHLVYITGTNTVTKITDNATATIPNGVFGIGYNKPSATSIQVIFAGIIGGYAGFTTGSPLFISTAGIPTHTVPATGMVQQIGFAVSASEFFVHLLQPMRRA